MNRLVIICICILTCIGTTNAQKGYELGGYVGTAFYFGDLNTNFRLNKPRPSFGIMGRRNFNTRISASLSLNYARVSADDKDSGNSFENMRNLNFYSNVIDLNANFEFNFFKYVHGSRDYWFTPYIFGGFNVVRFNPKTELNGETYALRDFGTEGQFLGNEYGTISTSFVYGMGMKWDINYHWSFNVHLRANRVSSDYFDDVSTTYPSIPALQAQRGDIAAALSDRSGIDGFATPGKQRGDSSTRDSYVAVSIGVMRYFGYLPCPRISNFK